LLDKKIRAAKWEKRMGALLSEKTVGIIGLGYAGKKLVELLQPFNCNIFGYDIAFDNEFAERFAVTYLPLDQILINSDIVSVHLALTKETEGLFDTKVI